MSKAVKKSKSKSNIHPFYTEAVIITLIPFLSPIQLIWYRLLTKQWYNILTSNKRHYSLCLPHDITTKGSYFFPKDLCSKYLSQHLLEGLNGLASGRKDIKYIMHQFHQLIDTKYLVYFIAVYNFQYIVYKHFFAINLSSGLNYLLDIDKYENNIILTGPISSITETDDPMSFEISFVKVDNNDNNFENIIIWKSFAQRLWFFYKQRRLLKNCNQLLYKIIVFLSLIHLQKYQCDKNKENEENLDKILPLMTVPKILNTHKMVQNELYNSFSNVTKNVIENSVGCQIFVKQFDLQKDGKVGITAKCGLFVDWGGGYWCKGGRDSKIYQITFELSKNDPNQEKVFIKLQSKTLIEQFKQGTQPRSRIHALH